MKKVNDIEVIRSINEDEINKLSFYCLKNPDKDRRKVLKEYVSIKGYLLKAKADMLVDAVKEEYERFNSIDGNGFDDNDESYLFDEDREIVR